MLLSVNLWPTLGVWILLVFNQILAKYYSYQEKTALPKLLSVLGKILEIVDINHGHASISFLSSSSKIKRKYFKHLSLPDY